LNSTHFAHTKVTHSRCHRSPKIASKTDKQVADELFIGHQAARVDFTAELDYYDSPECCPDRICQTCGIDHDFRPDFRNTKTSIDVIAQILRVKSDGIS
jgi:hypothetical protein